ncbi:uncharacterized protein LOC128952083 [Oppia nitens]|uniref:uncharacterized protein LOC128952083 n=1 Tax=Oppia nitens TaxID=1686743 RepID=UPI0023DA9DBC|nr:uncharacterized protein LOC128952083 [Oppia nitens]
MPETGGYEPKRFIGLEDWLAKELECSICLHIFRQAVDTQCGHTFCRLCIQRIVVSNKLICPQCRCETHKKRQRSAITDSPTSSTTSASALANKVDPFLKSNRRVDSIIGRLRTNCDYEDKGCEEVLELNLLDSHLEKCNYNLCDNCGLKVGKRLEHNCLDLMKSERKRFMNTIINYKFRLNNVNKKLRTLEQKNRELESELRRFKGGMDCKGSAATAATNGSCTAGISWSPPTPTTTTTLSSLANSAHVLAAAAASATTKTGKTRALYKIFNLFDESDNRIGVYRMKSRETFGELIKFVANQFNTDDKHLSLTLNYNELISRNDTIPMLNVPSNKRTLRAVYRADRKSINIDI